MLNSYIQWNFSEYWWQVTVFAGILILLSFIAKDLRKQIKALSKSKQLLSNAVVDGENTDGGVLLLSSDRRILGATKLFYEITGLSAITSRELTLEDIAYIFPDDKRIGSVDRLEQTLEQGEGKLELVILSPYNEEQHMMVDLFRILDGSEQIAYYVSFKLNMPVH